MHNVEPKVYLIGKSKFKSGNASDWLRDLGASAQAIQRMLDDSKTDGERIVESCGRRCYMSFEPGLNPNVQKIREDICKYIDNILEVGHGSVIEHVTYTFAIENVSRVFTGEMNRHRAGMAISEGSMRYIRFEDIPFWLPTKQNHTRRKIMKHENNWGHAQMQVALFMAKMNQASGHQKVRFAPDLTDIPSDAEIDLRCRLMLEECLETIKAMKREVYIDATVELSGHGTEISGDRMSEVKFKKTGEIATLEDFAEIADGLADQKVVVVGTDVCFGFNADAIFDIVQGNNNAKFRPGHTYNNGKLIKPPDHKPPTPLLINEIAREMSVVHALGTGTV